MDSLDIGHWLCDLVMQSPLIPTYDEYTLEWRKGCGEGVWGVLNRDTGASCIGACPLCEFANERERRDS